MGTAFGAAIRETGGELQLMSMMGYDATTFGNHDFDLGPDGLGKPSAWPPRPAGFRRSSPRIPTSRGRRNAGRSPAPGQGWGDPPPPRDRARRHPLRHLRVARQGSQFYTSGAGAVTFPDAIETAREMVKLLRETEKVGRGHRAQPRRRGERQGRALHRWRRRAPGRRPCRASTWSIGGHSHTELHEAIIVNGRTPVVQTGK